MAKGISMKCIEISSFLTVFYFLCLILCRMRYVLLVTGIILLHLCSRSFAQSVATGKGASGYTGSSVAGAPEYCSHILVDNSGRLWICTFKGLTCFDGSTFTTYTTADGLPDNTVLHIAKDASGFVYVATPSGIARFTGGYGQKCRRYNSRLASANIYGLCAPDSNHIYFGDAVSPGLRYLHNDTTIILPGISTTILDIAADKRGLVYAMGEQGAVYYISGDHCYPVPYALPSVTIANTALMAAGEDGEVYLYDGQAVSRITIRGLVRVMDAPFIADAALLAPGLKDGSCVIAGMQYAIVIKPGHTDTITYVPGSAISGINGLAITRNGLTYMAGDHGLWAARTKPFMQRRPPVPTCVAFNDRDANGRMRNSAYSQPLPAGMAIPEALKPGIFYIYKDRQDTVWLCMKTGLYTLNGGLKRRYVTPPGSGHAPGFDSLFNCATETADGTRWFSSFNGLVSYKDGQFRQHLPAENDNATVIYAIAPDSRGNMMMATALGVYAFRDGRYRSLSTLLHLPPTPCLNIICSRGGGFWLSLLGSYLYRIVPVTDSAFTITDSLMMQRGKEIPIVQAITEDKAGRLWVDYGKELIAFLPDGNRRYAVNSRICFTTADGLRNWRGGNPQRLSVLADGRVQLREQDTAFLFSDSTLTERQKLQPPPVLITGLLLERKPADWAALGYRVDEANVPLSPSFNYRQNYLTFQFAAVEHLHPEYVTYRYRLKGIDESWQPVTQERTADYNNLPPGQYVFEVVAADIDGRPGSLLQYRFTIRPPWYRTLLAYLLYALLAGLILYSVFTLRLSAVRRKSALEKLVVEQQLKALRAQINPHFLQNTFDFLDQSLTLQPVAQTRRVISQLSSYLRNVLYRTDEAVLRLEDELAFAEEYLAINQLLFGNSFDYKAELGDDVDTIGIKVPSMILQPILENAIKHGVLRRQSAEARPLILLKTATGAGGSHVRCSVTNTLSADGGAASVTSADYRAKGLENTRERLELFYKGFAYKPSITMGASANGTFTVVIAIPLD